MSKAAEPWYEFIILAVYAVPVVYVSAVGLYWLASGEFPGWTMCGRDESGIYQECRFSSGWVGLDKIVNFLGDNPFMGLTVGSLAAAKFLEYNR